MGRQRGWRSVAVEVMVVTPRHRDVRVVAEQRCRAGHVRVLRCHPLRVGGRRPAPFPTLFWLSCPELSRQMAELERYGLVTVFERRLADDATARARVDDEHGTCVAERWALLNASELRLVAEHGFEASLRDRGIGGIRDRATIKCLHLHYAHHLARGSIIGEWIEVERRARFGALAEHAAAGAPC